MDAWRWALGYLKPYERRIAVLALLFLTAFYLDYAKPLP